MKHRQPASTCFGQSKRIFTAFEGTVQHHDSWLTVLDRCNLTIIPAAESTREQILQVLPGHDAIFLANHQNVDDEFLDIAGKLFY